MLVFGDEKTVILAAVKDIIYMYNVVLDLIKDEIPLFYKHFVVFIRWDIYFIEEGETLRHLREGTHGAYKLFLFGRSRVFVALRYKMDMRS